MYLSESVKRLATAARHNGLVCRETPELASLHDKLLEIEKELREVVAVIEDAAPKKIGAQIFWW